MAHNGFKPTKKNIKKINMMMMKIRKEIMKIMRRVTFTTKNRVKNEISMRFRLQTIIKKRRFFFKKI